MVFKNFRDLIPELIVWEDICQHTASWPDASDLTEWYSDVADAHVEQVGFVIAEDKKNIIIADSVVECDSTYSNVMKIPKSVILKRVPLKEVIQDDTSTSQESFSRGGASGIFTDSLPKSECLPEDICTDKLGRISGW